MKRSRVPTPGLDKASWSLEIDRQVDRLLGDLDRQKGTIGDAVEILDDWVREITSRRDRLLALNKGKKKP